MSLRKFTGRCTNPRCSITLSKDFEVWTTTKKVEDCPTCTEFMVWTADTATPDDYGFDSVTSKNIRCLCHAILGRNRLCPVHGSGVLDGDVVDGVRIISIV